MRKIHIIPIEKRLEADEILDLIEKFIRQKPGFGYQVDKATMNQVASQKRQALRLLDEVRGISSYEQDRGLFLPDFTSDFLIHLCSGSRLNIKKGVNNKLLVTYVSGQYHPVEYRWAMIQYLKRVIKLLTRHYYSLVKSKVLQIPTGVKVKITGIKQPQTTWMADENIFWAGADKKGRLLSFSQKDGRVVNHHKQSFTANALTKITRRFKAFNQPGLRAGYLFHNFKIIKTEISGYEYNQFIELIANGPAKTELLIKGKTLYTVTNNDDNFYLIQFAENQIFNKRKAC